MDNKIKNLSKSSKNYLRAVHKIINEKTAVRVKDIAELLGVGKSSVSEALKVLADKDLIHYESYGIITLTGHGNKIAEAIDKRRLVLRDFFEKVLLVSRELAEETSYKVEEGVPDEVLVKFVLFLEFMQLCSCKIPAWMKGFKDYSTNNKLSEKCLNCTTLNVQKTEKIPTPQCCEMNKGNFNYFSYIWESYRQSAIYPNTIFFTSQNILEDHVFKNSEIAYNSEKSGQEISESFEVIKSEDLLYLNQKSSENQSVFESYITNN
jgi:DtxR family transcriptional regulator, Mn-dependent transcriptional regulator